MGQKVFKSVAVGSTDGTIFSKMARCIKRNQGQVCLPALVRPPTAETLFSKGVFWIWVAAATAILQANIIYTQSTLHVRFCGLLLFLLLTTTIENM